MKITTGKLNKAQRVVIYGPEGIGKTTFGSKFPNPVFIDTEGSTEQLDVARTPKPYSWTMLKEQVNAVPQLGFETLVIDTIDWAERLCAEHVCAVGNKTSIEDFGYGKGFTHLEEEFGRFLNLLNEVREKGIHVVIVAHAQIRKFEQPDEMGAYDRWELKLSKKCSPLLKEWADCILFANYETYSVIDDQTNKKKAQGGKRVMHTSHNPCWDAKNRYGLSDKLNFDFAEIAHCLPGRNVTSQETRQQIPPQVATGHPENYEKEEREAIDNPATTEPMATDTRIKADFPQGFPVKLMELMQSHGVQEWQIRKAVAARGYYPEATPIDRYEESFIDGVLVAAWPQVHAMIKEMEYEAA